MIIFITTTIFTGNMSAYFPDQKKTAKAYAQFLLDHWFKDLKGMRDQGHQTNIKIKIQDGYTGLYSKIHINTHDSDLKRMTALKLAHEDFTWKAFLNTKQAEKLFEDSFLNGSPCPA